uniref:EF-hand domain-containing protein n=1 Tax=Mesocestoides corti TaxID=53468 RepID=A0A5K3FE84_MESCO
MHKVERTGSQENEVSEQLELPAQVLKMSEIIFKKIDEESRGTIPIRCLPQALRLLDQAPTESDLKTIAANNKSDSNDGTGQISFKTFSQILRQTYLPRDDHFNKLFNAFAVSRPD